MLHYGHNLVSIPNVRDRNIQDVDVCADGLSHENIHVSFPYAFFLR